MDIQNHTLTPVHHRGERAVSCTNHFTARESTISTHWVGPTATLDTVEVRPLLLLATNLSSHLSCPAQSLLTALLSWLTLWYVTYCKSPPQWPHGLRCRSTAVRLLGSWVRIPPGGMDVCLLWVLLSGRGPCDELAPRPGKSYWLWCVVVCNFETSWMRSQNKAGWTVGRRPQQIDNVAI